MSTEKQSAIDLIDYMNTNLDQAAAMATLMIDGCKEKVWRDYFWALSDKLTGLVKAFAELEERRGRGEIKHNDD